MSIAIFLTDARNIKQNVRTDGIKPQQGCHRDFLENVPQKLKIL